MQVKVTRRQTCRLCDSKRLELVVPLAPTPVAEKYVTKDQLDKPTPSYPLDLHICLDCGHVQMLDAVDPAFLFDAYTYKSGNTKKIVDHFDEIAQATMHRYKIASGLAVDIGSNDGSLLGRFKQRGMQVLGVDPAREIASKATESGIPTIPEFMSLQLAKKIKSEHGPASVVTAFNVFAHNDDIAGMADSIRELLAPHGVFVFEASYLLDILDKMLLGTIFHEHVSHHSIKPLIPFLRRHGLELIDVQRNSIQGGSIVGTAQLLGGTHTVSKTVTDLLELERVRKLDQPETLRRFSENLQQLKRKLDEMMSDLKRQGKTVWGFGAARSGTTLIAQMGLGKTISHIVDDSPDKQNQFSPGDHIPILPTKALYEKMPDYVFILAWIHAQPIIQNNRAYVEKGGRFIICVPEIQVIGPDNLPKK
jgi:2-polyprenyl-3-methyl-5-hydroxy-6-metoxy-1,4-benzoquinol methylase